MRFCRGLGATRWESQGPVCADVRPEASVEFLNRFAVDGEAHSLSLPLIRAYIERQVELGELVRWTVAVRGRESREIQLGEANWGVTGGRINQISRSRIKDTDSVGGTSPVEWRQS